MGRPKLYTDEELREHHLAQQAKYRLTEAYQEGQRKYGRSEKRRIVSARHYKQMTTADPVRAKAYAKVRWAIISGRLATPKACFQCGREVRLSAHHHLGYAEEHWLDVQWLCRKCHRAIH